jgi:hypothetical protein
MCERPHLWEWRCQLLEQDDIRGVIAIYGGTSKPAKRSSPMCTLYDPIAPPRRVTASYEAESHAVRLELSRPAAEAAIPTFLTAWAGKRPTGFAYVRQPNDCPSPSMFSAALRRPWPEQTQAGFSGLVDQPPPGAYCYAVWSIDGLGRPSSRVATSRVQVPEPETVP